MTTKRIVVIIVLTVLLAGTAIFAMTQGSISIPVSHVFRILSGDTTDLKDSHVYIVLHVRLPRILLASMVGASLACIGAAFQAVFRNPMADPYIMGVSSGAAFGATIGLVLGLGVSLIGYSMVSSMAFLSSLASVALVYALAQYRGRITTTSILLAGVVVSYVLSAIISMLMILHDDKVAAILSWTMGSFNASSWSEIKLMLIPFFLGVTYFLAVSKELNALSLSEEEALSLGVNVQRTKKVVLLASSAVAAFAVSVSGIIGFVGLVVPHVFRMIVGSNHKILIPTSILGGALFLLVSDTIARSFVLGFEPPVGIITSLIGGPFFLFLLQKHKRSTR